MKRWVLILLCLSLAAYVLAESGRWELTPRIIELPGGLVLNPEAPGAVEYRGITALRFLKEDLAVVEMSGREFSAFYEMVETDARGNRLDLRFKDNRILSLGLVKTGEGRYLYLYRMAEDFFPSPLTEPPGDMPLQEPPSEMETPGDMPLQEPPSEMETPGDMPSQESPSEVEAPGAVPAEPELPSSGKGSSGPSAPEDGETEEPSVILVSGEMIKEHRENGSY